MAGLVVIGVTLAVVIGGCVYFDRSRKGETVLLWSHERLMTRCVAEFMGTFFLVFIGCGALVMHAMHPIATPGVAVIIAFGGSIAVMIMLFGAISGAHINPAVSTAFWVMGYMRLRDYGMYVISQCGGALCASYLHKVLFVPLWGQAGQLFQGNLGQVDLQSGTFLLHGMIMEGVLTFLLVFVIVRGVLGKLRPYQIGIFVGLTLMICGAVGGSFTGASLNPARALAPEIISAKSALAMTEWMAVYLFVPLIGGVLGGITARLLHGGVQDVS